MTRACLVLLLATACLTAGYAAAELVVVEDLKTLAGVWSSDSGAILTVQEDGSYQVRGGRITRRLVQGQMILENGAIRFSSTGTPGGGTITVQTEKNKSILRFFPTVSAGQVGGEFERAK